MSGPPSPKITGAILLSLIAIGLGLRLAPIGRYVTPDEPNWVYRSIQFSDALAAADWSAIPPTGHPGVTTMWLATLGIRIRTSLHPEESARHLAWIRRLAWLDPTNGEAFRHLAFFLPVARIAVATVTSLSLAALYPLLSHLFGWRVALLTVGLLVFDPLLTGHSGLLHTDALLATFIFLALVTALSGLLRSRHTAWWALTGLFGGLALLTKSPALILLAYIPLLLASRYIITTVGNCGEIASLPRLLLRCLLILTSTAVTFSVLHPGVWADPAGAFLNAFSLAERHLTSVQRPIFFMGQLIADPGPAFYPLIFVFRVSPIVVAGLLVGLFRLRRLPPDRRFALSALLLFAILFSAVMSLGTKKHDRYLLPVFPPLALGAALSVDSASTWYSGRWSQRNPSILRFAGWSIILVQAVMALAFTAYPLTYYNPLLGGSKMASRVIPTGWGEALGAAAMRLNRVPNADRLTVAASSVPSFAPLFEGRTLPLDGDTVPLSDYVVSDSTDPRWSSLVDCCSFNLPSRQRPTTIYTNTASLQQTDYLTSRAGPGDLILADADTPLQRRYKGAAELLSTASLADEAALADWLARQMPGHDTVWLVASRGASPITAEHLQRQLTAIATPVHTATVASATIAKFNVRPSAETTRATPPYRAAFAGQLALVDAAPRRVVAWPASLEVTLRWRALANISGDYLAVMHLRDSADHSWATRESPVRNEVNFPTSAWSASEWSDATYKLRLSPGMPPDHYTLEVSLYDLASRARLGATGPNGDFRGTRVPVGAVVVAPPAKPPRVADLSISRPLNAPAEALTLIGMDPVAEEVLSGDSLSLGLLWQAEESPSVDYRVRWRLLDSGGEGSLEAVFPLSSYPPTQWRSGDRFRSHYCLRISPDVSPGRYRLGLSLLDGSGEALWQRDLPLAMVQVLPRERSFTLPDIPHRLDVTFGETIHLRGYALSSTEGVPGETVSLTLTLQADGPTDRSYTLFVHLLSPDEEPSSQVDLIPGAGMAPTTSWAKGQVVVEEVTLTVPPDAEAGTYRIAVGFYDAAYGGRLPVAGAAKHVLPQDRAVVPQEITVEP